MRRRHVVAVLALCGATWAWATPASPAPSHAAFDAPTRSQGPNCVLGTPFHVGRDYAFAVIANTGADTNTDPSAVLTRVVIDFGDGSQQLLQAGQTTGIHHTYSQAGSYTVNVTCTESTGAQGSGSQTVSVNVSALKGPPTVVTGAATVEGSTGSDRHGSATLTGAVTPNGAATTAFFDFGRTKKYGQHTSAEDVGDAWVTVEEQRPVSGLAPPGAVYHYRLVARNSYGTSYGTDKTVVVPLTGEAPAVELTHVHLYTYLKCPAFYCGNLQGSPEQIVTVRGTVNPNGAPTRYIIYVGAQGASGWSDAGSGKEAVPVEYEMIRVPSTNVSWVQLVAKNAFGETRARLRLPN